MQLGVERVASDAGVEVLLVQTGGNRGAVHEVAAGQGDRFAVPVVAVSLSVEVRRRQLLVEAVVELVDLLVVRFQMCVVR